MARARPRIVSRLREHRDAVAAAEAALEEGLALLPLVNTPEAEGTHELHIYLLGAGRPVVVLAEVAGAETDARFPLLLRPLEGDGRSRIRAFLAEIEQRAVRASAPPPASQPPLSKVPTADALPVVTPVARRAAASWSAPAPASSPPPPSTDRIAGKYRLGPALRAGGTVFKAIQAGLDKTVALRVLRPTVAVPEDVVASFRRAALAASELDHPAIARVLDFGQDQRAPLFLVTDLLAGHDLRSVLREEVTLSLDRIVAIIGEVCSALAFAHERGVAHREVKPANVFLLAGVDDDGAAATRVKLADFGVAEIVASLKFLDPSFDAIMATGTPQYMAPEQARGERPTPAGDIYACGVMLYEMATGRLPFPAPASVAEMVRLQASAPPPSSVAPSIDRGLEAIILRAMSKDPGARHESARDLRAELRALLGGARPVAAAPPRAQTATPAARWARAPSVTAQAVRTDAPSSSPPASVRESSRAAPESPSLGGPSSRPPSSLPSPLAEVDREAPPPGSAAAARAARAAGIDDGFEIPMSAQASVRSDALEIDFSGVGGAEHSAHGLEDVRNQPAWVALELMTSSLRTDPEGALAPIDALSDVAEIAREMRRLDKPIATLASRGEATALRRVIAALQRRAGGAAPTDETRAGFAARRMANLATDRESLAPLARVAIDGAEPERTAAFAIIAATGGPGAHAACVARKRPPEPSADDRARFVEIARKIGAASVAPLAEALKARGAERALLEDLLDAIAAASAGGGGAAAADLGASAAVADLLAHDATPVRQRAVAAFASVLGPRAHARLIPMLKTDPDEAVRAAVVEALRRTRGLGRDAILHLDTFLNGATPAGLELRVAAAAALGEADIAARPQAAGVLARALKPPQQGLLNKLVSGDAEDARLVTTLAKSLLAVGGADASSLVESRAAKSSAEVKRQLLELIRS